MPCRLPRAALLPFLLLAAPLVLAAPVEPAPDGLEEELRDEPSLVTLRLLRKKGLVSDVEYRKALQDLSRTRVALPSFRAAPGEGLTVTSPDRRFAVTLRSRIQLRGTLAANTNLPGASDLPRARDSAWNTARKSSVDLQVRTLRLSLAGHVLDPQLKYVIQLAFGALDFESGNPSPVFDAWLEYSRFRDANVRVGQFFVPFDRARTIREFSLQFVDRQQPVQELSLDRDMGVEVASKDLLGLGGRLGYALFLGSGDGRNNMQAFVPGLLGVGRLAYRPFGAFDDDSEGDLERSMRPRVAFGIAAGFNHQSQRPRSTTGTRFLLPRGFNTLHLAADMVLKWAGFSVLAELLVRNAEQNRHVGVVAEKTITEFSRSGAGLVLQGGAMLTDRVELVGRFNRLVALGSTDPALRRLAREQGNEAGLGVNTYLNGHRLKAQADWQVRFGDARLERGTHVVRVQLDATF